MSSSTHPFDRAVPAVGALALAGPPEQAPVDPLQRSLRELGDLPWYDAESQQVIPVELSPDALEAQHRGSRWTRTAANSATTNQQPQDLDYVGWTVLAVAVLMASWLGYRFWRVRRDEQEQLQQAGRRALRHAAALDTVIEQLPIAEIQTPRDLLTAARHLADDSQLNRAVVYLYGHLLLTMDSAGQLELARGKTNHQYLRELRSASPEQAGLLRDAISLFERSFFGQHGVTRDEFESLWRRCSVPLSRPNEPSPVTS
jgi:hypothetical protein